MATTVDLTPASNHPVLCGLTVIGQRSFFVNRPKFIKLFLSNVEKIVVDNAIFRLSIALFIPEIFVMEG